MKKVGIIVLHWHNTSEVHELLHELCTWRDMDLHIFVVDNSGDFVDVFGSANIHIIDPGRNIGFAAGCNAGMEKAIDDRCNALLLLNADINIQQRDVLALIDTMQRKELDAVSPVLQEKHKGALTYHFGGRNPLHHTNTRIMSTKRAVPAELPAYLPGTVLLLRASTMKRLGLLDPAYFFSGEVADWFLQHDDLISFAVDPDVFVEHHQEGNTSARRSTYIYYSLRNRFLLMKKHGGQEKEVLQKSFTMQLRRQMLGALMRLNGKKFMTIFRAIRDGRAGKFGQ